MALLQHTGPLIGDSIVNDDGTVTTDGVPNSVAAVSTYAGTIRLDVNGNGLIDASALPILGAVRVTRVPGQGAVLGYRAVLEDWEEEATPSEIELAVYSSPNGESFSYSTGKFLWDIENEEWYTTCPLGSEPGQVDIYMGLIHKTWRVSPFTMYSHWDEQSFPGGGKFIGSFSRSFSMGFN